MYRIIHYAMQISNDGTYCDYGHDGNSEAWVYNPNIRDDLIKGPGTGMYGDGRKELHQSPAAMYNPKAHQRSLQGRIDHDRKVITVTVPRTIKMERFHDFIPWNVAELKEQLEYIKKLFAMDYPDYKIRYYAQ